MLIPKTDWKIHEPLHSLYADYTVRIPSRIWEKDWEWSWDFPEIRKAIGLTLVGIARRLWIKSASAIGVKVTMPLPHTIPYVHVEEFSPPNLEALASEVDRRIFDNPIMIVIGPRDCKGLNDPATEFVGYMEVFNGKRVSDGFNVYSMYGVPVIVSPYYDGEPILLPDMTGQCRFSQFVNANEYSRKRMRATLEVETIENRIPPLPRWEKLNRERHHGDSALHTPLWSGAIERW